ncbi:MAG: hypothetical protein AVDCRST_MAG40-1920 [uncultured Gemmatimonadaceae bacterium]|uniref:Uncharacterized protein n=1 Tax=uncultured Gemmatimonadaceae bacterium TaxID=246130 RepID=A0A6J4LG87_9BACT|nr:MAG: hypothetical protein AVDCRST_MAG40-1920 [uncultured Gemmatimonadaceae bacterium]
MTIGDSAPGASNQIATVTGEHQLGGPPATGGGGDPHASIADAPDELRQDAVDEGGTLWNPAPEPSRVRKGMRALKWLPGLVARRAAGRAAPRGPAQVVVAIADHYEPAYLPRLLRFPTSEREQEARVERWCRLYRSTADRQRDANGFPLVHTYFLPAEDLYPAVVERLVEFARAGYGELEVQLHHGIWQPDTAEATRATLEAFRDLLVAHGCLSRWNGVGAPRYGFVHGNWALANSNHGRYCGVDGEMQILADTGCYADFTMPSAPDPSQVGKTNSIYECTLPFGERAPHRAGRDLSVGRPPTRLPLIVQGPLALNFPEHGGARRLYPRIEIGEIASRVPPTVQRAEAWRSAGVTVDGRPDWLFVKLHCHGLGEPRWESLITDERVELVEALQASAARRGDTLHFVSAREMVNIALAACDGREGSPSDYRDYRLQLITPRG